MARKRTKKRKNRDVDPDIPVESFSDIAFLLIIFFILATTLTKTMGFFSEIPAGEKSEASQAADKTPTVQLQDRTVRFNNRPVDLPGLRERLAQLKLLEKKPNERVVLLETGGAVPYQTYFETMQLISQAGGAVALVEVE